MKCFGVTEDGVVKLNYTAYVIFMQRLPGALARQLQLRASFFDAFTDIGSPQARSFLAAKLQRAENDPAAEHLRSEMGNPEALTLADVNGSITHLANSLAALEVRLQKAAETHIEKTGSGILDGIQKFVKDQLAQWSDWRVSLRTSFDEAIAAARNSGFLQIGRQVGGSGVHLRRQEELLAQCRQIPADQFEIFKRSGCMLCISTFLENSLPPEQQYIIRHFMPTFATALKERKLREATDLGETPWIAWKEGEWRIVYTETDRAMMRLLFQEEHWQQRLRDMLVMHRPPTCGSRSSEPNGLRGGPYSRPRPGGSSNVNAESMRSFFRQP